MAARILDALEERSGATILALGLGIVLVIAGLDYVTELAFSVFYLVPVVATAWVGPAAVAAVVAIAGGLAVPIGDLLAGDEPAARWIPVWNFAVRSGTYLVVAGLTGALRRALDQERALARSRRTGNPLTVAYLDLDGFKSVNDGFGHSAGDDLLKEVASALSAGTRPTDAVGRLGGDEFALLFPDSDAAAATNPLNRARATVRAIADRTRYAISVSVGAATFLRPPEDVNALLRAADELMYEAKKAGKDRIVQRVVEIVPSGVG